MAPSEVELVDPSWKGMYRAGGVAMLINAALYLIGTVALAGLPSSANDGEAFLKSLAGVTLEYRAAVAILALADFLFIPITLALYFVLKRTNKTAMLLATGLLGAFMVLDLRVNISNLFAMATLSQNYVAATSDVQRAALVVAANYILAMLATTAPIYEYILPSFGVLIISSVMLKGIFTKPTAYTGIAASIFGFIGVVGFVVPSPYFLIGLFLPFSVVWFLLAGFKLYRLGKG